MTIGNIQKKITNELAAIYDVSESQAIMHLLMEHVTGLSRMQRMLNRTLEIEGRQEKKIANALQQLLRHQPIQYVLREAWFMNMKFFVTDAVLIPRPETEELVKLAAAIAGRFSKMRILDIGTGSGCIPVGLKKLLSVAAITTIDISEKALEIARKNAQTHDTFIELMQCDFLNESLWQQLPQYDMIISNPPYIPVGEQQMIDKHVIDWEPELALFVPDNDPLLFYRKMALFGRTHLAEGGKIVVETHQDYAVATADMFDANGYDTILKKDMYGNDRMVIASMLNVI